MVSHIEQDRSAIIYGDRAFGFSKFKNDFWTFDLRSTMGFDFGGLEKEKPPCWRLEIACGCLFFDFGLNCT